MIGDHWLVTTEKALVRDTTMATCVGGYVAAFHVSLIGSRSSQGEGVRVVAVAKRR